MSQAFFLTRQTANLMEDFVRELTAGAGLFLLYGEAGVGKTRALQELARTRLGERKVRWIDLKAGAEGDGALVDSSALVEKIFGKARKGDIIIADHFEMALKKTRHQLFLSWSTDGLDKHLNLIIAGNTSHFNELRQIAQQYQVRVQSFQQMPLSPDEASAFLGFYLFPDRPIGRLSVPPLLRNQIDMARGNIGAIIEVAERAGDQITSAPMDDTASIRKDSRLIVGALVTIALLAGIGWYLFSSEAQQQLQVAENALPVPTDEATLEQATAAQAAVATPVEEVASKGASEVDSATALAPVKQEATETREIEQADADAAVIPQIASSEVQALVPEPETVAVLQQQAVADAQQSEPDEATPTEASAQSEAATLTYAGAETAAQPPVGRLQRDLQASMDWINRSDRTVGTLQIMLLSKKRFDEQAYYDYIGQLEAGDIDTASIRILATLTGGKEVYSVVYGEYPGWKEAGDAKSGLPAPLRQTSPIPRSVGGLLDEIRRLEERN